MNTLKNFTKGLIKENPVLVLVLGTCPTLATSTSVINALGMGAAATIVLLCSNIVISALRKVIPDKVRIPCYIVLIAGFVTAVQMLVKAFAPDLDKSLGIYLPLLPDLISSYPFFSRRCSMLSCAACSALSSSGSSSALPQRRSSAVCSSRSQNSGFFGSRGPWL